MRVPSTRARTVRGVFHHVKTARLCNLHDVRCGRPGRQNAGMMARVRRNAALYIRGIPPKVSFRCPARVSRRCE
jgi:hypothetical protein